MWKSFLREWFVFSKSERRGAIVLGIVVLVTVGIPLALGLLAPTQNNDYQQLRQHMDSLAPLVPRADRKTYKSSIDRPERKRQKFFFNPNTISQDSLQLLGFSPKQANAIINYRKYGGFKSAQQFLRLNVVSNHQHLSEYIRIEQRQYARSERPRAAVDTASVLRRFAAAPAMKPIDINSADTADLKAMPGIGNYLAQRIVDYRQKLGGYTHLEQLCEIKYFDQEKLMRLQHRLTVDTSKVKRIPLTKEGANMLRLHPYVGAYTARGIAQQIKYDGGASTTLDNLVKNNILTSEQAEKLRGYVVE
jgi:DNA uptake protein ComE-like DNA-binding protein